MAFFLTLGFLDQLMKLISCLTQLFKRYLIILTTAASIQLVHSQSIFVSDLSGHITSCVGSPSLSPYLGRFTVSGNSLSDQLVITASAGFEVSTNTNSDFSSNVSLIPSGGTVSNTVIYVRLQSHGSSGIIVGTISASSTRASTQSFTISGTVNALPVMNPSSDFTLFGDEVFPGVAFTSTTGANTYEWSNSNSAIGLPSDGLGNISPFTAINPNVTSVTSTITVTPLSTPFAYIPNGSNQVKVINTVTREIVASIPVGLNPRAVAIHPDGYEVYVSNHDENTISVISSMSNAVIHTIGTGQAPLGMAIAANKLYVANRNSNTVSIFTTTNHSLITSIPVSSFPNSIVASPTGDKVYVSHTSGSVTVISTATNAAIATIPVPSTVGIDSSPEGLAVSADGSKVFVANNGLFENNVAVINTVTNIVTQTIPVGEFPFGVALSANGKWIYVTNRGSGTVSVISTQTGAVINTISVGAFPQGISTTSDGLYIYVSNKMDGNVSVISEETSSVIDVIEVGSLSTSEGNFITQGTGCIGEPIQFTITVHPARPKLEVSEISGSITSCAGSPSIFPQLQWFNVSGIYLNDIVEVLAPPGFEVSISDQIGFTNSLSLSPTNRVLDATTVYVRLSASAPSGQVTGNVAIQTLDGPGKMVPVNGIVYEVAFVNPISDQLFTHNTLTAPVEFVGTGATYLWMNSNLAIGLDASGSGTELPSFEASNGGAEDTLQAVISVIPISANSCNGSAVTFIITVRPKPPVIENIETMGMIKACVGEVSADPYITTFIISGTGLKEGILVTTPTNFEVAQNINSNYGSTTLVNAVNGEVDRVKVYVRSSASAPVGTHNANVVLSSLHAEIVLIPVKAIVHAFPIVNKPENLSFVNGETTQSISFIGNEGSLDYLWSNNNVSMGLAANGRGKIEPFMAINTGSVPVSATLTVRPKSVPIAVLPNKFSDNVSIINTDIFKLEANVPAGDFAQGIAIHPNGKKAYAINFSSNDVSVISLETLTEIGRIPVAGGPAGIAINHQGNRVYVYNSKGDNRVSVIDTESDTILQTVITLGSYAMVVSPDDQYLFTSSNGIVNKLDAETLQLIDFVVMGMYNPHGVALEISPNGEYLYATSCKESNVFHDGYWPTDDFIYVINTSTMEAGPQINVWQSNTEHVDVSEDGDHVYIMNIRGELYKISTHTNSIVDTIMVSLSAFPFNIIGNRAYIIVSTYNTNDPTAPAGHLRIVDLATEEELAKVYGGEAPVAFGQFMTNSTGCIGAEQSFTITVYPDNFPLPVIQVSDPSGDVRACGSSSDTGEEVKLFTVSAENVTDDMLIMAPPAFEISTSANANFGATITLSQVSGIIVNTNIYFRLKSNARVGTIREELVIATAGANSKKVVITGVKNELPQLIGTVLPNATYGVHYSYSFSGYPNTIFSADTLPPGLSISSAGTINGIPTQANENLEPFTIMISAGTCSQSATFSLRVNKQPTSISVSHTVVTYDGTPRSANVQTTPTGIGLMITYNGSTALPVNAGDYNVVATIDDPNYIGGPSGGLLQINKASLTATASNSARPYGQANDSLTFSYTGFQNNETSTVIDIQPSISTTATSLSDVGVYPITLTGGYDNNYSITLQSGTLTITQIEQLLSLDAIQDKNANDPPFAVSATTNSGLHIVYSVLSGPAAITGDIITLTGEAGDVFVQASQAGNVNYLPAYAQQSFNVQLITEIEKDINQMMSIYPNPTTIFLNIKLPEGGSELSVTLVDAIGRTALNKTLIPTISTATVDIGNLTSGLYVVRLIYRGHESVFRIIKK